MGVWVLEDDVCVYIYSIESEISFLVASGDFSLLFLMLFIIWICSTLGVFCYFKRCQGNSEVSQNNILSHCNWKTIYFLYRKFSRLVKGTKKGVLNWNKQNNWQLLVWYLNFHSVLVPKVVVVVF